VTNQIEQPLEDAIPNIVPHGRAKLSTIPKYLTEEQLERLLSSFNLSTRIGLRDRAITLLIARLGIRGREVANLHLEDINWRQGIIQLRKTKSRRTSSLPLLKEVGEALVAYLQKGRPHSQERHVFLTHSLPVGKALSTDGVRDVIRQALHSSLSITGSPHILRHTLATHLLQKSAKLKEIADVLRHCSIETTNIYAKVDLKRLAEVALPWPEVKP
jgi:site-specific recombinase XerD